MQAGFHIARRATTRSTEEISMTLQRLNKARRWMGVRPIARRKASRSAPDSAMRCAAIDRDSGPLDVARLFGAEKRSERRNVVGLAEASTGVLWHL
jgi:hypothetical protein